jgi:hypothetical protein
VYRTYANNFLNVSPDFLADSSTYAPAPVRLSGSLNSVRRSVSQLFILAYGFAMAAVAI